MNDKRSSSVLVLVAVIVLLTVVLGAYVGAYFMRATVVTHPQTGIVVRQYPTKWEAALFKPAGWFDGCVTRRKVMVSKDYPSSSSEFYRN
jgi:hypothetical protein